MSVATNLDAAEIKRQAAGRWRDILPAVAGIPSDLLDGRGHPCPACGGTDRFSTFKDFAATGGVICRGCHATGNGDGFAAVQHIAGVDFPGAVRLVAEYLGGGGPAHPVATQVARTVVPGASVAAVATEGSESSRAGNRPDRGGSAVSFATEVAYSRDSGPSVATRATEGSETAAGASKAFDSLDDLVAARYPNALAVTEYPNRQGVPQGAAIRIADPKRGKSFRQARREGNGTWTPKAMDHPPLLRSPQLVNAEGMIVVVEGEKDVESAESIGVMATTWPGGADAVGKVEIDLLAGRDLLLLPDNDDKGRSSMRRLIERVGELRPQPSVRWLQLDQLIDGTPMPEKGDLSDWIDAHSDAATPETIRDNLLDLVAGAERIDLPKPAQPSQRVPFPVGALPAELGDYCRGVAKSVQVDVSMVALPVLTAAAAAIGASREAAISDDWIEPPVLWGATVGPSGSGKTPSAQKAFAPVRKRDTRQQAENAEVLRDHEKDLEEHKVALEGWKKATKGGDLAEMPDKPERPAMIRSAVSDITPEALAAVLDDNARGLLCERDELSGFLGGFGRYASGKGDAERAAYLSVWSADRISITRKTGDQKVITVDRPHVCVYGGVQPELLHDLLTNQDVASGLPARFLWSMPPIRRRKLTRATVDPKVEATYHETLDLLYGLQPIETEEGFVTGRVRLSDEAWEVFREFHDDLEDRMAKSHGPMVGALAKLKSYSARLALVVHCVRERWGDLPFGEDFTLDADSMRSGAMLANWFASEASRVFGLRDEDPATAAQRRLIEWIERRGGQIAVRDLAREGPPACREPGAAERMLRDLQTARLGRMVDVDTAGRPRAEFVLFGDREAPATATEAPETRGLEAYVATPATDCDRRVADQGDAA